MLDSEYMIKLQFQSTLSARRATPMRLYKFSFLYISIHALREESDGCILLYCIKAVKFQSTLSARRATAFSLLLVVSPILFQSTLSARRATLIFPLVVLVELLFQSTLSARRATKEMSKMGIYFLISIHALREESDL